MKFNAAGNQILVTGGEGLCVLLDGFEGTVPSCEAGTNSTWDTSMDVAVTADCLASNGLDALIDCECCVVCCDINDFCLHV